MLSRTGRLATYLFPLNAALVLAALLLALAVGVLAGLGSGVGVLFPALSVLVLAMTPRSPDLCAIAVLVMTNSIFKFAGEESYILSVGGYGLLFHEVVILLLFAVQAVQRLAQKKPLLESALDCGVMVFVSLIGLAMVRDLLLGRGTVGEIFGTGRGFVGYLMYFLLIWGIQERKQFDRLMKLTAAIAAFTAVMSMAQYVVGADTRLLPGLSRVELLSEDPLSPTRVLPIGLSLIAPMLLVTSYQVILRGGRPGMRHSAYLVLLAGALLVSFTRAFWVGAVTGFTFMVLWSRSKFRGLVRAIALSFLLFYALQGFAPALLDFGVERLYQGFGLLGRAMDASTLGRIEESQGFLRQALSSADRILLGTGMLGRVYVSTYRRVSVVPENGYVHLFYAAGLLGVVIFVVVCFLYFRDCARVLNRLPAESPWRAHLAGFRAAAIALLVINLSALVLTVKYNGVIVMALAMALPRLIARIEGLEEKAGWEPAST